MSYIVRNETPRRSRGPVVVVVGAAVVVLIAVVEFLAARAASPEPAAAPQITWSVVGEQPVPSSREHGPRQRVDGLAAGFSHDELGAALAAMHISSRLVPTVPAAVAETTARQQCVGDVAAYLARLDRSRTAAVTSQPGSVAGELYYRVVDGDPDGSVVRISLAAVTGQARTEGGYAELTRTLRWAGGDWRMELPPPARTVVTSLSGYTPLGWA